jgi:hypothetical protein
MPTTAEHCGDRENLCWWVVVTISEHLDTNINTKLTGGTELSYIKIHDT